jgi:hypothetical protein
MIIATIVAEDTFTQGYVVLIILGAFVLVQVHFKVPPAPLPCACPGLCVIAACMPLRCPLLPLTRGAGAVWWRWCVHGQPYASNSVNALDIAAISVLWGSLALNLLYWSWTSQGTVTPDRETAVVGLLMLMNLSLLVTLAVSVSDLQWRTQARKSGSHSSALSLPPPPTHTHTTHAHRRRPVLTTLRGFLAARTLCYPWGPTAAPVRNPRTPADCAVGVPDRASRGKEAVRVAQAAPGRCSVPQEAQNAGGSRGGEGGGGGPTQAAA